MILFLLKLVAIVLVAYFVLVEILKRLIAVFEGPVLAFCMQRMHGQIESEKQKLFNEAFASAKKPAEKWEALEIGIGFGENFRCLPSNTNLTVIDVTDKFLPGLKKSIKTHRSDITVSDLVVCSAEDMSQIASNSMDVVFYTFVFCSIKDANAALREIHRVLKPGGVFIFMDHEKEHACLPRQIGQLLIAPVLAVGCKFKDIEEILKSGPFDKFIFKRIKGLTGYLYLFCPVVYGFAVKTK